MQSGSRTFHYHACASSLGGVLDTPVHTNVLSQASVSLPQTGGHASNQRGYFNHENIVSCHSTFTRVSGRKHHTNGGWTSQVTCIVEGLNVLQVVTADRVVAQISVEHSDNGGPHRYCFAGSHFYGLRVGGKDVNLSLNPELLGTIPSGAAKSSDLHWKNLIKIGESQAVELAKDKRASPWAIEGLKWMLPKNRPETNGYVLCSLVDDVKDVAIGKSFGHYLDIPDVGRITLGELIAYPHSVQITMVHAELGCHVKGQLSMAMASSNGTCKPPCNHEPPPH